MTRPAPQQAWAGLGARPDRRELVMGAMLLAVAGAAQVLKPQRLFPRLSHGELSAAIPQILGEFRFATASGLVLPPKDELSERLYDEVLTRVYVAPAGPPVFALFAYGSVQNLSLELHRPEECYPQQGFEIGAPEPLAIAASGVAIPATVLTARRRNGYCEQVIYWSRIGESFPPSRFDQSLQVARENFAGSMPDGMLVRLSVPTVNRGEGISTGLNFVQMLDAALPALGRRIIFGRGRVAAT